MRKIEKNPLAFCSGIIFFVEHDLNECWRCNAFDYSRYLQCIQLNAPFFNAPYFNCFFDE